MMKKTLLSLLVAAMVAVAAPSFAACNISSAKAAVSKAISAKKIDASAINNAIQQAASSGCSSTQMKSLASYISDKASALLKVKKANGKKLTKAQIKANKANAATLRKLASKARTIKPVFKDRGQAPVDETKDDVKDDTKNDTKDDTKDTVEDTNPEGGDNKFSQSKDLGGTTDKGLNEVLDPNEIKENPQQISPNKKK